MKITKLEKMTQYPEIHVQKADGKYDWWQLSQDCEFCIDGVVHIIPKGYVTDFASVPRWLWPVIPPHGQAANACVVHDYLYDNRIGKREQVDLFFYEELLKCVPGWQAWLMYKFVRWMGKSWWDN